MRSSPDHLPPPEPKQDRIVQLDALRGIAAVWVMLYHYTIQYGGDFGHGPGVWRVPFGQRAVELFFMISGFVIPMTLGRTRRAMDFVVSRFSRLYPTFWTCVLITAGVIYFAGWPTGVSPANVAANLTMVPQLLFHQPYVDPSYWTLEEELLFYVITFIGWRLAGMTGVAGAIGGLTVVALADGAALRWAGRALPGVMQSFLLLPFIAHFAIGYALFRLRLVQPSAHGFAFSCGLLAAAVITVATRNGLALAGWAVALGLLVTLAAFNRAAGLSAHPLLLLGAISYPMYLLHQQIGYVVIHRGYQSALYGDLNICLAVLATLGLATLVHCGVEKPALRAIRQRYKRFACRKKAGSN